MVTRAFSHSLDAFTAIGGRNRASAHTRLPQQRRIDDDLAPLGIPALALGVMLTVAGLTVLPLMTEWAIDYGHVTVYTAYILYLTLTVALSVWGVRRIRDHRRSIYYTSNATQSTNTRR
ncbi:hypothetical protein ACLMAJ_35675 [Nocardia sp. KC 131]|uniref:hypothetical protein n=1 Tax=Nocardia arseniciresistens TaxID=3392119 RepID=UPI00398F36D8